MKIYNDTFMNHLKHIMDETESGEFDFTYANKFHPTYIAAQSHIAYISAISKFRKDKILTAYLCSHPLIEAFVIKEIMDKLPADFQWAEHSLQDIVDVHLKYVLTLSVM